MSSLRGYDVSHRRLEYLGAPNYIVMFVLTGLLGTYTLRYIVYPRCKKLHHYITKRRVENTLDQYDNIDFEEMLERTAPRIDPETGELFMGVKDEKLTEAQEMAKMLREQREAEAAAYAEEHKYDDVILGPDGKPLLEQAAFDEYGNVVAKKKEGEVGGGGEDVVYDVDDIKDGDLDSPVKAASLKKKKSEQRKLSPKKLALIEQKRKEDEEFRKAYAKSLKIPSVEDRVKVVKEEFEKYMLFGKEPLGYQLKLETRKRLEQDADKEQFMIMRRSNYFHKLVEKEWIESERERHRKVKFDKRPRSAHTLGLDYDFGAGRNDMGFEGKKKGPPAAGARDHSVISRGFGSLPTRPDSPAQKQKRDRSSTGARGGGPEERQYFARDGSGKPASEQEKQKMIAEARSRSNSPNGRSPSPEMDRERTSNSPPRQADSKQQRRRPMTASQFRRAHY